MSREPKLSRKTGLWEVRHERKLLKAFATKEGAKRWIVANKDRKPGE